MPKGVYDSGPKFLRGDIWDFHKKGYWIGIPVNIGWTKDGINVMGAGLAQQAKELFPKFPSWFGERCKRLKKEVGVCLYDPGRLLALPSKPLNEQKPWLSWKNGSDLDLIAETLQDLKRVADEERFKIAIPWIGCGNGGLERSQVKPLILHYLDQRITVVRI